MGYVQVLDVAEKLQCFPFHKYFSDSDKICMRNLIKASNDILALRKSELSEKDCNLDYLSLDQKIVLKQLLMKNYAVFSKFMKSFGSYRFG